MVDEWVSPTSHNDPDNAWSNEANAYDGSTTTHAQGSNEVNAWSSFLELEIASVICSAVRYWSPELGSSATSQIDIDVADDRGAWYHVYEGAPVPNTWNEKSLGVTKVITKMRVRYYNDGFASGTPTAHEFDFWETIFMDTQESITTYLWNLLTGDSSLETTMGGTVRCYLTWAEPDAAFPYLVHRIDIRKEPGTHVVQRATYYLDIWSDSPNADEILAIRKRLIELLDELIFSTNEVSRVHIEVESDGFVPEVEQGIFHYAMLWDLIFRRDSEASAINSR